MKAVELKTVFSNAEKTDNICQQFKNNELSHVHLKGLVGSAPSFVANGIFSKFPVNQVFILDNEMELKYLNNAATQLFHISPNETGDIEYNNTIDFRQKIQYNQSEWSQLINGLNQLFRITAIG